MNPNEPLPPEVEGAASLAPDDPERIAVESQLQGSGTRQHWDGLAAETETLRTALRDVPVPSGLTDRLGAIADAPPPTAAPDRGSEARRGS